MSSPSGPICAVETGEEGFCSPGWVDIPADGDQPDDEDEPEVTLADIAREVRTIPMPKVAAQVQPAGRTLVNVPTILYGSSQTLRRNVTLLGEPVEVMATPTTFTWSHGDGTTQTTGTAGRPYPARDVTHRYRHSASAVAVSVDTTYTVRFRVDGGAWQDLGTTLTADGPSTTIAVRPAAPVLTR